MVIPIILGIMGAWWGPIHPLQAKSVGSPWAACDRCISGLLATYSGLGQLEWHKQTITMAPQRDKCPLEVGSAR
jgi:hypothetical protein